MLTALAKTATSADAAALAASTPAESNSRATGRKRKEPSKNDSPLVETELTSKHPGFQDYVRKEARIPEQDPRYQAGNERENRFEPPLPEVPGDVFDRQRVMVDFKQAIIERQVCLVLGTGGIGQNTAMTLARLGVDIIMLVDCDTYEVSNLTRQMLGAKEDVDQKKVSVARKNIEMHNLRSRIETYHMDVLEKWPEVVNLGRRAHVVFNCIDIGASWDFCVNSLCKELQVPLVQGQSYAWFMNSEYFSSQPNKNCASCGVDTALMFGARERDLKKSHGIGLRLQEFLQTRRDSSSPSTQSTSSTSVASSNARSITTPNTATTPTTLDLNFDAEDLLLFLCQDKAYRLTQTSSTTQVVRRAFHLVLDSTKHASKVLRVSDLHLVLRALHDVTLPLLLPGEISRQSDLFFLPRPAHVPTRFIGSWVCPCLAVSAIMVSQFVNALTGPSQRDPPTNISFLLDQGMTDIENTAYELGEHGASISRADRSFASSPSSQSCAVCRAAQAVADLNERQAESQSNTPLEVDGVTYGIAKSDLQNQ
eukprot:g32419.t1